MGLNCLLISTNQVMTPYPVYPLGVAHLAGALEAAGHHVFYYDVLAHGGVVVLRDQLLNSPPDLVGLSIRNLDTVDSTAPDSFIGYASEVMSVVRECSTAPVVLGGPAFSIVPEEMMALLQADFGIVGEGEILLPWLADCLEQGRPPAETILRSNPSAEPWAPVLYDKNTVDYYLGWGGMLNVQTKRGCPYRCAYCSYPSLEGCRYRFKPPEAVAETVIKATRDFGAKYVFFTDSVFNDAQGHYLQVAEALVRAGNKTPWCAFFRPEGLKKEALELLKSSGLSAMELGTDAASDTTLAGLNKGFDFAEVIRANDLAGDLGIPCAHFIIFGGPGENSATLSQGIDNIARLKRSVVFAFTGIRVLPGTAMEARAVADGVMTIDQSLLAPFFYFSPDVTAEEIDIVLRREWTGRFDRIYPASVMEERIRHLHRRGHEGPMWDFLVRQRG